MKKFITFRSGENVPRWMMDYKSEGRENEIANRNGKITFNRSVIAVRDGSNHTALMPVTKGHTYMRVSNLINAVIGGVGNATGVHIRSDEMQKGFGQGLIYTMGNSGKPLNVREMGVKNNAI